MPFHGHSEVWLLAFRNSFSTASAGKYWFPSTTTHALLSAITLPPQLALAILILSMPFVVSTRVPPGIPRVSPTRLDAFASSRGPWIRYGFARMQPTATEVPHG